MVMCPVCQLQQSNKMFVSVDDIKKEYGVQCLRTWTPFPTPTPPRGWANSALMSQSAAI